MTCDVREKVKQVSSIRGWSRQGRPRGGVEGAAIEPNCRLLCHFACAPWATSPVLGMQVLDLEAPGNPIMEPHLKAGQLPQSTIALIHFHYWHLSIWD